MNIKIAILTVSDRSAKGERQDLSAPELARFCEGRQWEVTEKAVVSDEVTDISVMLKKWADSEKVDVILTTGGTGFAPRDVTPEATREVIEKEAPGLAEAMRYHSAKTTPHAYLSRGIAGIRRQTLIINLPGSPSGALENLKIIANLLPHAVELLQNCKDAEEHHQRVLHI